jgi:hypothetical protein
LRLVRSYGVMNYALPDEVSRRREFGCDATFHKAYKPTLTPLLNS